MNRNLEFKGELRVALCESTTNLHSGMRRHFEQMFALVGYAARIEAFSSIEDTTRALNEYEYHALITDLSFNRALAVGLDFIRHIKTTYPDIYVIACSAGAPTVEQIRNNQPSFDLFLPKHTMLTPSEDLSREAREFESSFRRCIGVRLEFEAGSSIEDIAVRGEPVSERDLSSLLSQCLADLREVESGLRPDRAVFKPLKGGLSGSCVLEVALHARRPANDFTKLVMKISPLEWAKSEHDNFQKYVKWMMPPNKRTEIVGQGRTAALGAITYGFIFGGERQFQTLNDALEAKDLQRCKEVLGAVFDPEYQSYYQRSVHESQKFIGQQYKSRYFSDDQIQETRSILDTFIPLLFNGTREGNDFQINGEFFANPVSVIFRGYPVKYSEAVCHGDLNATNIVCTNDGQVAYIDFQDSGPAHIFQDFASVESSIRLIWGVDRASNRINADGILQQEEKLLPSTAKKSSNGTYTKACEVVRELATINTVGHRNWEYIFAVAALSLKLLRLKGLNRLQQARLMAAALVSSRYIYTFDEH
jgi:hypothetical protein